MIGKSGLKGLLVVAALAAGWPAIMPAHANGGGSAGTGSVLEPGTTGTVDDESDATGSIGGTAPATQSPGRSTDGDASAPAAMKPADGTRPGAPCPPGYLLSEDGQMCARP